MIVDAIVKENTDYLANVPVRHFDKCLEMSECAMISLEETDKLWNEMLQELSLDELNRFRESGMLTEAEEGKKTGIIEKLKGFLKKIWSAISGMVNKCIEWLRDVFDTNKIFIKKNRKKIQNATIPDDGLDIGGKWYTYTNLVKGRYKDTKNEYFSLIMWDDQYVISTDINRVINSVYQVDGKEVPKETYQAKYKEFLRGEEKSGKMQKGYVDKEEIINSLERGRLQMKILQDLYKQRKKSINDQIKDLEKKETHTDIDKKFNSAKIAAFKEINQKNVKDMNVEIELIKEFTKQNKAVAVALIKANKK